MRELDQHVDAQDAVDDQQVVGVLEAQQQRAEGREAVAAPIVAATLGGEEEAECRQEQRGGG